MQTPVRVVKAAVPTRPAPTPVPVSRRGASPYDALEPADNWLTLEANGSVWYKAGSGNVPQRLEVWLDAHGREGINFAVYSPEQMNDWSPRTPPKGQGASNKAEAKHDLIWVGQSPAGGTWYIRVVNHNPVPVPYKVGSNRMALGPKDCITYLEWIGANLVNWTACK